MTQSLRRFGGAVLVAVGILIAPDTASACSCVVGAGSFIVESGAEFPRNAAGFPWLGQLDRRHKWTPPPKQMFRLQQVAPGRPREVAFDLQVEPRGVPDRTRSVLPPTPIVLVRPLRPLVPGARYRLTFRPTKTAWSDPDFYTGMRLKRQQVEYTVGEQDLTVTQAETSSLIVGKPSTGELSALARCGSCWTTFVASQQPVEFELPPSARRWRSALLYSMVVDGTGWRPRQSSCSNIPHGRSWVGTGKELVYSRCTQLAPGDRCKPDLDIASGTHDVEMTAWLPGTPLAFTARAKVTLACK